MNKKNVKFLAALPELEDVALVFSNSPVESKTTPFIGLECRPDTLIVSILAHSSKKTSTLTNRIVKDAEFAKFPASL